MAVIKITELGLPGVKMLEPVYFEDFRGYYCETYSSRTLAQYGIETVFRQDNHALSVKAGIIRGIHFQLNPKAQVKLVRCTRGRVMDFAVDLRRDSPTFKKWVKAELSEENRRQMWIPAGFGHAYITLTETSEVLYKVDEWYYPEYDRAIAWDDPDIGIDWGTVSPVVSEKDARAPKLKDSDVNFSVRENG
jgi:dTDP-4-dehydrorhamnose 3,5-epimerase